MRHLSADTHGAPSWSPGWSTVTRNLLVNSYGAGHGIDHDDGTRHPAFVQWLPWRFIK